ncbi:uncharacterized protein L203_105639 [Cryptococcus depauperatus CBS 7841]|uniref:Short-chain dehydrogenase/reductase 3 n=1 Tax=Cryptococcus depauperatus CBS 7841 TaxID=1295531 RepID=A0AAJ8M3N2_9TREE
MSFEDPKESTFDGVLIDKNSRSQVVGPFGTENSHLASGGFVLDTVVNLLYNSILSPLFTVFLSIILYQVRSTHLAFTISCLWSSVICLTRIWNQINRLYSNQRSPLFHSKKLRWKEQVVLVTGGGSGIGACLAETLAARNAKVVVLTREESKHNANYDNIHTYKCDVSVYKEVEKAAVQIRKEVGDPTIIVNNAGVVKGKLLLDLTEEDINSTFGSNTLAQFWILKIFLPAMLRQGAGHVVTMSSLLGIVSAAQMSDYCASKAAVLSLHQTLRLELDNRYHSPTIRTTLVVPAYTVTSLFSRVKLPSNCLFSFLCPPVQPDTIAKQIIDALEENESRIIRLPSYTNLARFSGDAVGLVPAWMRDFVQWLSGADHAMTEYGPRPDAGERLAMERRNEFRDED